MNKFLKKKAIMLLTLCVLLLMFGQISSEVEAEDQEPKLGGTLRIAGKINPWVFNGVVQNGYYCFSDLGNNIMEHLVKFGPGYTVEPLLAESWEASADGTVWTWHVVQNATWHDGEPFTGADVAFTYRLLANLTANDTPPTILPAFTAYTSPYLVDHLVSIETPDDYTVVMTFDQLTLLQQIIQPTVADSVIMPKHVFEGTDLLTNPAIYEPIGTGPFTLKDWVQDNYYILERNENYWGNKAYLDTIIFYIVSTPESAAMMLETGQVDMVEEWRGIPLSELPKFRAHTSFEAEAWTYNTLVRIALNCRPGAVANFPWLADVNVRKAMHYAIDKQGIVESLFFDATDVNPGPVPTCVSGVPQPEEKYEYNVALANQLLDDAGWPVQGDGWRFDAGTMPCYEIWTDLAQAVKEMWREIGIKVDIQPMDTSTFASNYESSETGMGDEIAIALHNEGFGPDMWVASLVLHSDYFPPIGHNLNFFNDSLIDEYLDNAVSTVNETERNYWYDMMSNRHQELVPAIHIAAKWLCSAWHIDFAGMDSLRPHKWASSYAGIWWVNGEDITPPTPPPATIEELLAMVNSMQGLLDAQAGNLDSLSSQIETLTAELNIANNVGYLATGIAVVSIVLAIAAFILKRRSK